MTQNECAFLPEEDKYILEHIDEQDYEQLAANLAAMFSKKRTKSSVCNHCNRKLHITRGLRYSKQEDQYLRDHIDEQSHAELAENLTRLFGRKRTETSVRVHCWNSKILMTTHYYSDDQIEFVRKNAPVMSLQELADAYNAKFARKRSKQALYCLSRKIGAHRNAETMKRIYANNGAQHSVGDGSIHVKEGRVRIKVNGKWRLRTRVVWEKYRGAVEPGYVIIHLDGDSTNDDIDNLMAVPRRCCGRIASTFHGFSDNADLNAVKIKYCELADVLDGKNW